MAAALQSLDLDETRLGAVTRQFAVVETVFRRYEAVLAANDTAVGNDLATANTEFLREGEPVGRQGQTWVRLPEGWRAVAAHVSLIRESP